MKRGHLFILSAPSGAGKSTVLGKVMAALPGLVFSVSHTTRPPRKGESDGREYHFVDRGTFSEMSKRGDFLEWAEVHGNLYGTSRSAVEQQLAKGVDVILDIDVQGASIIRDGGGITASYIFLAPPDLEELERRLRTRGLDDEETIARRLANARKEMAAQEQFEYLIVNDRIDAACRMVESVILATRARQRRGHGGQPLAVNEPHDS